MVDDSAPAPSAQNCVVILGPTATGKTGLAVHLARVFGGEIISADSRQVYRGLDIGSGKDLGEYGDTPYHLIDVADLSGEYSVFNYQKDFYRVFPEIIGRGKLPVIAGGTGMYLDAVIRGYSMREVPVNEPLRASLETLSLDELAARLLTLKSDIHNRTDLIERPRLVRAIEIAEYNRAHGTAIASGNNPENSGDTDEETPTSGVRPEIRPVILGVKFERSCLRARIRARLEARLDEGLVDEVRDLHDAGFSWERLERLGLEYRFTAEFLQGKIAGKSAYVEGLYTAICQFAKRQETWFRGMERKGVKIEWIPEGNRGEAESRLAPYFARMRQRG